MIWLQSICVILSVSTMALAIHIARKFVELKRHIEDDSALIRRLVPRIERLEKRLNIK